jgi:hypothetical protein
MATAFLRLLLAADDPPTVPIVSGFWDDAWNEEMPLDDRAKGLFVLLLFLSLAVALVGWVSGMTSEALNGSLKKSTNPFSRAVAGWFDLLDQSQPVSFGAAVLFFLLIALLGLDRHMRWAGAAAAVPALLVLLQYVYLWAHKPSEVDDNDTLLQGQQIAARAGVPNGNPMASARDQAQKTIASTYGARTLFIRYGFPAIVLMMMGLILAFMLVDSEHFFQPAFPIGFKPYPDILSGARHGAVGAYVWITMELGRRSFRRDVTGGIALWSIVTLALGPILAAVVALLFKPKTDPGNSWQAGIVLFYAGYSPRTVLAVISSAASQFLRVGPAPSIEMRTTPLTRIRGITPAIEERLAEEGILNAETLATVEPIRLLRDTSFDLRSILWWVDEALLMMYVPNRWQLLEEQGITGATDLAALAWSAAPRSLSNETTNENLDPLQELAEVVSMKPETFRSLIDRVSQDRQVAYIWWLYDVYLNNGVSSEPEKKGE